MPYAIYGLLVGGRSKREGEEIWYGVKNLKIKGPRKLQLASFEKEKLTKG